MGRSVGRVVAEDKDGKLPPNRNGVIKYSITAGNRGGMSMITFYYVKQGCCSLWNKVSPKLRNCNQSDKGLNFDTFAEFLNLHSDKSFKATRSNFKHKNV